MKLILNRMGSTPWGTFGNLTVPGLSLELTTLEPQWRNNVVGKSCIPAGTYALKLRSSPIVERASGGVWHQGFEITGVPKRSLIMLHPGNWQEDSNGCILVGLKFGMPGVKPGITSSRVAFNQLMTYLTQQPREIELDIRWNLPETLVSPEIVNASTGISSS